MTQTNDKPGEQNMTTLKDALKKWEERYSNSDVYKFPAEIITALVKSNQQLREALEFYVPDLSLENAHAPNRFIAFGDYHLKAKETLAATDPEKGRNMTNDKAYCEEFEKWASGKSRYPLNSITGKGYTS